MIKMSKKKNSKILVVDDASFTRKFLGKTIEELGFCEIHFASDAYEAVAMAEEIKPNLVTLDITMPGMDGLEAIEKIMEVSSESKIIMVSAAVTPFNIITAIRNGAVDFIPKPFTKVEIEERFAKHI